MVIWSCVGPVAEGKSLMEFGVDSRGKKMMVAGACVEGGGGGAWVCRRCV